MRHAGSPPRPDGGGRRGPLPADAIEEAVLAQARSIVATLAGLAALACVGAWLVLDPPGGASPTTDPATAAQRARWAWLYLVSAPSFLALAATALLFWKRDIR